MTRYLDVHLELDTARLRHEPNPTRTIAEASAHAAQQKATQTGVRLRHPEPAEVYARTATTPTGLDVLLVATRWVIDGQPSHLTAL